MAGKARGAAKSTVFLWYFKDPVEKDDPGEGLSGFR